MLFSPQILAVRRPLVAAATWQQTWSDTLDTDISGIEGFSVRNRAVAASISTSGSSVRVTFAGTAASGSTTVDHASIVERDPGTWNGVATPTELLFSAGSGFTIAQGGTIVSDALVFAIDESKDYLVIFDVGASNGNLRYHSAGGDGAYYVAATASYNAQTVGFMNTGTNRFVVSKIEVLP